MKSEITTQDLAMAMIFTSDSHPLKREVTSLRWSEEALSVLFEIHQQATEVCRDKLKDVNAFLTLPTNSLRALFQFQIDSLLSVDTFMGLKFGNLRYKNNKRAFAVFELDAQRQKSINSSVEEWVEYDLTRYMERWDVADNYREDMFRLLDDNKVFLTHNEEVNIFPWGSAVNGTASPTQVDGYAISANDVALLLENKEIMPECGSVLRNVGDMSGQAELMSFPIERFAEGRFSFVCQISIQTVPACPVPLIYFDFIRRRWLDSLTEGFTKKRNKSAFLISKDNQKSYGFYLEKNRHNNWKWNPEDSWEVLTRRFSLGEWGEHLIERQVDNNLQILATHDFETEGEEKNQIGAGVPEVDRLSFFKQIAKTLEPLGFQKFSDFKRIQNSKKLFKNATYFVNNDFIKSSEEEQFDEIIESTLSASDAEAYSLKEVLTQANANILFQDLQTGKSSSNKAEGLSYVDLNRSLFDSTLRERDITLLIIGDDQTYLEDLKKIVEKLLDKRVSILTTLLPEGIHGPRKRLEGNGEKDEIRKQTRIKQWERFVEGIGQNGSEHICLIQARQFYQAQGKYEHDDIINKPAAKIAFASKHAIPTQYLLPPNLKKNKANREKDYLTRIQQALLDLVFGHQGCVYNLKNHVEHYFSEESERPKCLYGVTAFSPTSSNRAKSATIGISSRLIVETGLVEVKMCHQESSFIITDWMSFKDAISYVTNRYNQKLDLGTDYWERKNNFRMFCQQILEEAEISSPNSFIFFHAEKCNQYWDWLKDTNVSYLEKAKIGNNNTNQWKSLRVVRVRNQTPKLLQDKETDGFKRPTTVESLFRVCSSDFPVYWSLGSPNQHYKRGRSCYLEVIIPSRDTATGDVKIGSVSPDVGQSSRPNAVEFVFLSSLDSDNLDQLARFCASLRRGIVQARLETWVSLPAPLYVLNKIEEYLKL